MNDPIIIIEKQRNFKLVPWQELVAYKDLLYFLVVRGIKARYAQSVLGIGWAIIQPLFTMLIFTVVFGNLARIDSDGVPYALFSLCGLVPWTYFSSSMNEASNSLVANVNMLTKVYFPRLILPLSAMIAKGLDFVISALVLVVVLVTFQYMPSHQIVYLPILFLLLFLVSAGPSILLAAWSVQYRDIKYALTFIIQILLYAAPVVYPLSLVPEGFRVLYALNPLVGVIEGFRAAILGSTPMPWQAIGLSYGVASFVLIFGLYTFSKLERTFADVA